MLSLFKNKETDRPENRDGAGGKKGGETLLENALMASFIQNSAVATFVIDTQHKVLFWNSACEELTGVKAKDVVGTSDHWKPFYHHLEPCAADYIINDWLSGEIKYHKGYRKSVLVKTGLHTERFYASLGGKARYVTFDAAPIFDADGKLMAAVETLHDITELKKAQDESMKVAVTKAEYAAIEREGKYIASIINVMPISLIVVNPDATIRSVNPRTREFLGYTDQEMIGMSMEKILGHEMMDTSVFTGSGLKHLMEKGIIRDLQMNYLTREGKKIPVALSISTERDETAQLEYIVVIAKDMREIKRYAAERLNQLTPILQNASMGDFSQVIEIPEKEDEFTEHLVALNMMIRDLKETVGRNVGLVNELKEEKDSLEKKVEERTNNLDETNKKMTAFNKQLEITNKKLAVAQKDSLEKVDELELFNKMTMGREAKILELKDEVARLQEQVKETKPKKKS
jgi:PAS domain S-box-containing protein